MTIRADDLTPTIAPPDPNPKKPRITLPPLACDSHFHVFGPHSKFPYAPNRPFTPTDAPKEDLFRLHDFLGFQRGVFVQSTCHGSDHAALVDLLAAGEGRYRGVALLDPTMRAGRGRSPRRRRRARRAAAFLFSASRRSRCRARTCSGSSNWPSRTAGISPCTVGGNGVVEHYEFITLDRCAGGDRPYRPHRYRRGT